eukprot:GHVU01078499.1.p1 GENE.GHVU01078499.1~~GHVU01078499.1.p1  ORF type:complete len:292 (+),score=23.78 GHVU01078499.1:675-1550(+)
MLHSLPRLTPPPALASAIATPAIGDVDMAGTTWLVGCRVLLTRIVGRRFPCRGCSLTDSLSLSRSLSGYVRVLVACHDNDLEHVCGTKTLVQTTNHKGLPLMKDSSTLRPADTYLHSPFVGFPNEFPPQPIPKFKEVLEQCPDAFLHVDIKPFDCPEAVDMALDLVRRSGALARVVFSSFCRRNNRRIRAAQRTDEQVMRTVGPHKLIAAVLAYYVGLLPFIPFSEDAVAFPQCDKFFSGAREEFSDDVQRFVGRPLARLQKSIVSSAPAGPWDRHIRMGPQRTRGIRARR